MESSSLADTAGRRSTSTPSTTSTNGRRLDLDVVRGVAIFLAMGWHLNGTTTGAPVVDWILAPGSAFGWAGVDLFFVLSGFLMGQIILKERSRTGAFDSKRFMIRRAFKLWPVLYLFLVAQLFLGDNQWSTYLFQVSFHLQNFIGSSHDHLWSLAVEEHFYLVIALVFPLFIRRGGSTKLLICALAVTALLPTLLRTVGLLAGATPVVLQQQTQFRVDALAAGMLLAVLAVHRAELFDRLLRMRPLWAAVSAGVVVFLCLVNKGTGIMSTVGFTLAWVGAAAFLMLLMNCTLITRFRPAFLPLGLLGFYSYSVYIWHMAIANTVVLVLSKAGLSWPPAVVLPLKYAAAITAAVVLTKLVEKPMLRLRDRLFPAITKVSV